ncbi:MAG: DUF1513 domain-containing protein [Pseudomonadota bacterium]
MANRRTFLAGMLAAGLVPRPTWADAGNPAYLAAAKTPDGAFVLCGLRGDGQIAFRRPLPARGHAAAAHPNRPEAVAFARRPGTYAIVLDCVSGDAKARLEAPEGRHFYGHGAFSGDGALLFTTENDFDAARGMIGVWDARHGYVRVGEFASGGVGPHEMRVMPDGQTLVVANGGIETHPETGRAKLNLPVMRSNLTYLDLSGRVLEQVVLGAEHQRNSIRHLAVAGDSAVAFAMQWQGDLTADLPLLGVHRRGAAPQLYPEASVRRMQGYLGSVAMDGAQIAVTSPRSGLLQVFDDVGLVQETPLTDVCGVAAGGAGFLVTTGTGLVRAPGAKDAAWPLAWDNHLVAI